MDIVIRNICKRYGEKTVLYNFNAVIKEGKATCIMGKSGSGKTTLVNLLLGLERPDTGEIKGMPENCSAVFQENRLCENFSALSNIMLALPDKTNKTEAEENLLRLGIEEIKDKPIREFSGGMKRRVAILRAVMAKSEIVFFDEPFKGLDEEIKQKTIDFIKEKTKGKTVVIVTHNSEDIKNFNADLIKI